MATASSRSRHRRRNLDWQGRLLPRSVLGMSALLLAAALGAAFSGAVLYAYYEYRLDRNEALVQQYVEGFDERLDTAVKIIETEQEEARAAIRSELEPLQQLAASGETIEALLEKVAPSVFFVSTLAEDGSPSVGTAFVAFADAEQSYLLTSYDTVRAATRQPGPPVTVEKGGDKLNATIVTWEEGRDLALLSIDRGNLPRLPWGTSRSAVALGDRVFAISGLGAAGGSASQGLVADISSVGIQHDAPLGHHFQGGPLVNSNGEVVAIASRHYAPLGFTPDGVFFAPPIRSACERVLRCPSEGEANAPGG